MQRDVAPAGYDFHCHLDLYPDKAAILRNLERCHIVTLAMTTTPRAFNANLNLFGSSPFVDVGLGIHPELAVGREADIPLFESLLERTRVIGEVGLDGRPQHRKTLAAQLRVLREIFRLTVDGPDRIFSFHSTRAVTAVLDEIEGHLSMPRHIKVLHWFTGTKSELKRASQIGCYFSVNLAMCRKPGARELLNAIPHDLLLTETDGPFVKENKQPTQPSEILAIHGVLASLLDTTSEVIQSRVRDNAERALAPARR